MKILLLDIETSPNLAHVWGIWQQNVAINQIVESGTVLCWTAKWLDEEEIYFDSVHQSSKKKMLKGIYKLLDEADAVVHYNGKKFDVPYLNMEFLSIGLTPPMPYKQIDLLETVKAKFRFPSNKLEYVVKALGIGEKVKHIGFELWTKCMAGEEAAWKMMKEYNINDVLILQKLYLKVLPWIKGHANHSLYGDDAHVCPNCGSDKLHKKGMQKTLTSIYQRYKCMSCGHPCRDTTILNRNTYKIVSAI